MNNIIKWIVGVLMILILVFILGPQPDYPMYDLKPHNLQIRLESIDEYIADKESKIDDLKEDNYARVVWYNDSIVRTEYALVYLHGFSSSHEEGNPVHRDFANRYGMNMYLSRLADHGRASKNSFKNLTPKDLIESAKEAIAIGGIIGEKVIIMSCSTGSTYALMLSPTDDRVESVIMYSPNIAIADPKAKLVTYPWGKALLSKVMGGDYVNITYPEDAKQYWNESYHIDGVIAMQALIDDGMQQELFETYNKPIYLGCYYKDENNQDNIVSVPAMEAMFEQISTAEKSKRFVKFEDATRHVFTSHIMVDNFDDVNASTYQFAEEVLRLFPVQ